MGWIKSLGELDPANRSYFANPWVRCTLGLDGLGMDGPAWNRGLDLIQPPEAPSSPIFLRLNDKESIDVSGNRKPVMK